MTLQKAALFAMLAGLALPPAVHAETTKELIDRLAAQGRANNKWVPMNACQAEQDAVRALSTGATASETTKYISELMLHPWVYRYSGKVTGEEMSVNELREKAAGFDAQALKSEQRFQQVPIEKYHMGDIKKYRLYACVYRVAANSKAGIKAVAPAEEAATFRAQCAPGAVAGANRELQQIDQQLDAFMQSSAGQQVGSATPSLQAVMWGTKQQAAVLMRYCPTSDAHKQRVADLMESFDKAKQACLALQSRPEVCVPAAPQQY